jgi:formate-dependent nitrite reductase cytochrome c552 subunit
MIGVALMLALAQERVDRMEQCVKCHEDIQEDWKTSVHSKRQIGCVDCHGPDTIDPKSKKNPHTPEFKAYRKAAVNLCAKCHGIEAEEFKAGGHQKSTPPPGEMEKVRSCLRCHDNHKTEIATFAAIRKTCVECHAEGTPAHATIASFETGIGGARAEVDALEGYLKSFPGAPGTSDRRAKEALDIAQGFLKVLRQKQHAVKTSEFAAEVREAAPAMEQVKAAKADLEAQEAARRRRPLWLLAFLAVAALNLVLARRWAKRRFA